ncbi:hypothetical protein [Micromonospora sp. NPDC005174]|uniref:hypothetical protein n=1 Tax=Micromonospora sp. NPDC005174 TaxID=3157018 RepID=UPI0033BD6C89
MTDATSDYNTTALTARWAAVVNDEIGGWAVTTNSLGSCDGGRMAADLVMTREVAEHIADVHNHWLARQNMGVPFDEGIMSRSELTARILGYPDAGVPQPTGFITVDTSRPKGWWVPLVPLALAAVFALTTVLWLAVT